MVFSGGPARSLTFSPRPLSFWEMAQNATVSALAPSDDLEERGPDSAPIPRLEQEAPSSYRELPRLLAVWSDVESVEHIGSGHALAGPVREANPHRRQLLHRPALLPAARLGAGRGRLWCAAERAANQDSGMCARRPDSEGDFDRPRAVGPENRPGHEHGAARDGPLLPQLGAADAAGSRRTRRARGAQGRGEDQSSEVGRRHTCGGQHPASRPSPCRPAFGVRVRRGTAAGRRQKSRGDRGGARAPRRAPWPTS